MDNNSNSSNNNSSSSNISNSSGSNNSSNIYSGNSEYENECRVCRLGGDDERPLYMPCLCSGSIGLVHQDCLEAWLAHSKKDNCELCLTKYQFEPEYRPDMPSVIPFQIFLKSCFAVLVFKVTPITFRVLLAMVVWLIVVPLGTTAAYSTCLRRTIPFVANFSLSAFSSAVCYGLVIDGIIALSLLILVSNLY